MFKNAYQAYDTMSTEVMSGKEIEARALTKAATKLKACQGSWESSVLKTNLDKALLYNQKIWNVLQAELSQNNHPLPKKTREDLLSLSLFIDRRTLDILAYPEPHKLTALININLNIASGLRELP